MFKRFHMRMEEAGSEGAEGGTGGTASLLDDPGKEEPGTGEPSKEEPDAGEPPKTDNRDPREWIKQLDPDLAQDSSLKDITDLNSLAKSYVNAQKMIGKNKITLPDEFASEDDWKDVYKKLGLPESSEKYNPKIEEDKVFEEDFKKEYKEAAYEAGILPKQAEKLYNFFSQKTKSEVEGYQEEQTKKQEEAFGNLRKEWGAGFDKEIRSAQLALKQFIDDDMAEELKANGLDSNPTMIKLFNKVSKQLNEDTFSKDTVAHLGTTKDEADKEITQMMGDMQHPYWNSSHPGHKRAVERMLKLQEIKESGDR